MDQLRERLDALEHQLHTLHQQSRAVQRRLRWWRGLASGVVVLGLFTWALPVVTADDSKPGDNKGLEQRVAALEKLLQHFSREGNEIIITRANLRIVNGLRSTDCLNELDEQLEQIPDCPNGLGNLIVGYNEPREPDFGETIRTGSHNVVVGQGHNFSRFGGLVVGDLNTISGDFASITGGQQNTASGQLSSVSGGLSNTASGYTASVSGGQINTASGVSASVSGGVANEADGEFGGSVSGGNGNTASGYTASVSGGQGNWALGESASVSGGESNVAIGYTASVSGGRNRTAEGEFDWVAGSLFEDE